jgi:hypothetical protein
MGSRAFSLVLGAALLATASPALAARAARGRSESFRVGARVRSGQVSVHLGYASHRHSGTRYYGGYLTGYPIYGCGYPILPVISLGTLYPYWFGWPSPVPIRPSLNLPRLVAAPPVTVVELPPVEREEPEAEAEGGRRPPRPAPGEREPGAASVITLGRLRLRHLPGGRIQVQWIGDPRIVDRLTVEEQDAERRPGRTHEIVGYPFRATLEPAATTRRLRVRALAGTETLAEAVFDLPRPTTEPKAPGSKLQAPGSQSGAKSGSGATPEREARPIARAPAPPPVRGAGERERSEP